VPRIRYSYEERDEHGRYQAVGEDIEVGPGAMRDHHALVVERVAAWGVPRANIPGIDEDDAVPGDPSDIDDPREPGNVRLRKQMSGGRSSTLRIRPTPAPPGPRGRPEDRGPSDKEER
jgi:hypothetical protein